MTMTNININNCNHMYTINQRPPYNINTDIYNININITYAQDLSASQAGGPSAPPDASQAGASGSAVSAEAASVNPSSPGGRSLQSADAAWGLADSAPSEGLLDPVLIRRLSFNDRVRKEFVAQVLKKAGGVQQYLEAVLPSAVNRDDFRDCLLTTFPPMGTVSYQDKSPIPSVPEGSEDLQLPMLLHVSFFGYSAMASTRGAPGIDTSSRLLEQFMVDGFVSATEFIIVNHPVELIIAR